MLGPFCRLEASCRLRTSKANQTGIVRKSTRNHAHHMKKGLAKIIRKSFRKAECGKQDLNLHEITPTRPSI